MTKLFVQPKTNFIYLVFIISAVFFIDIASKQWVIGAISPAHPAPITSFFNLVLTINHGVSFSMLWAKHIYGVYALIALTSLLSAAVLYFIFTSPTFFEKSAFSLILGGALGNLFDRINIGGVVDFLDFHAFGYHWPAFNVADSAICLGVCLLFLYYSMLQKK
jgi:signal peptidase II